MLIGFAEVVPGISGGTVALVVGVYETLIRSIGHVVRGVVAAGRRWRRADRAARALDHLRKVSWHVVVPVGIGMVAAVIIGARLLEPLIEERPVPVRGALAGLIAASIVVPAKMVGDRWRARDVALAATVAVLAFLLTGIPPVATVDPVLPVVALAAAFAVCALVLPGVSGSFLLLTVGLYQPTLAALNARDYAYIGTFLLGAAIGLALFVSGLEWLLEHRRRATLVVMTGLMAGSLRALWPWQGDDRELMAPGEQLPLVVVLFVAGVAVILGLLRLERRRARVVVRSWERAAG